PTDPLNRANTDYALSQNCSSFCSPPIGQGPFPIPCAAGNLAGLGDTSWMESLCPSKTTAPVHNALAVGIVNMLDPNPCHCGSTQAHGGEGDHLALFDGKLWYQV